MCRHCLRLNLAASHSLSVRWLRGLRSWVALELGTSELNFCGGFSFLCKYAIRHKVEHMLNERTSTDFIHPLLEADV
jgi:hypothetical protein